MTEVTTYSIVRLKPLQGLIEKCRNNAWDVDEVVKTFDLENYSYFWFETIQMTRTDENDIITFNSEVTDVSGKYFINAYIEEYSDVCVNNQMLAQQMTNMGWTHIVRNVGLKNYWTHRFDPENDKLISLNGKIE